MSLDIAKKYIEYFNVDENYFPCIDDSAINAGAQWENTYPHETFIKLLEALARMLDGITKRSLWIYGAYGTGKSQCAYAIKQILEVSDNELINYWKTFEVLRENHVELLRNLQAHREKGILTVWRYASGNITNPQKLFLAIQESISEALSKKPFAYNGTNTLRQNVLAWLDDEFHAAFLDSLLKKPEYKSAFTQTSSQEIISSLKNDNDVSSLMENIFMLADNEGITALKFTTDTLRDWIKDVIRGNHGMKIIFIWDEFSDFFRNNANSLGEFQKVVSICQEAPFYFVLVTHPLSSLTANNEAWKIVQQRFDRIEITLPDNIAFELIAHALLIKQKNYDEWISFRADLSSEVSNPYKAVKKTARIDENSEVLRNILPLHPVTAFVLKNIASAFQSNQRSIFDFIKTPAGSENQLKAFQYFIANSSPFDDRTMLKVDMLWDFFYENGKDYLTQEIRFILDVFDQHKNDLSDDEQIVLKAVLIMQALFQRLGSSIELLAPSDENLKLIFDGGDKKIRNNCVMLAGQLVNKKILVRTPDNKMYSAAILAGDNERIEDFKRKIEAESTTAKLINELKNVDVLELTNALKLRYEILPVTSSNFKQTLSKLRSESFSNWKFRAVLALAKDDKEAQAFRVLITDAVYSGECENIIVIDALDTPLGNEGFESYVNYSAMSMYYAGNNNAEAKINENKAKKILELDWGKRITTGQFIIYTDQNQFGERLSGTEKLRKFLQAQVFMRFPYVLDFADRITEAQLKPGQYKTSALMGLSSERVTGIMAGREKDLLGKFWHNESYLSDEGLEQEPVTIISRDIHELINKSFNEFGSISIGEVYYRLENEFGFSQCNLSAFIAGFILRDYSENPLRSMDEQNHSEIMTPEKLAEMLGNFMSKKIDSFIVKRTREEQMFYRLTSEVLNIPIDELASSSPAIVAANIHRKIRALKLPLWCLEYVSEEEVFDVVKKFIAVVQSSGRALSLFTEIGKNAILTPSLSDDLKSLLTVEKCREGMKKFLLTFKHGRLPELADEIGISEDVMLSDIEKIFSPEYADFWNETTGRDEIQRLITEYEFIKAANDLMHSQAHSLDEAIKTWREYLAFSGCCYDDAIKKFPDLKNFLDVLIKIASRSEIRNEVMKSFLDDINVHEAEVKIFISGSQELFNEIYSLYLDGLNEYECRQVKSSLDDNFFIMSSVQAALKVKEAAETLRRNQKRTRLFLLWAEKASGTRNPREWSEKFITPILACVETEIFTRARKVFDVINSPAESYIDEAINFLDELDEDGFFERIADDEFRNEKFTAEFVGEYESLLDNIDDVREKLLSSGIPVYDWSNNPAVKRLISDMARRKYKLGKIRSARKKINDMNEQELRAMLGKFINNDILLGLKIIMSE